jgi:hypothetical protein
MLLIMMVHIVLIKALNKVEKRYFEKTDIIFPPTQYFIELHLMTENERKFEI